MYCNTCPVLAPSAHAERQKLKLILFFHKEKAVISGIYIYLFFLSEYEVQLISRSFSRAIKASHTVGAFVVLNLVFLFLPS